MKMIEISTRHTGFFSLHYLWEFSLPFAINITKIIAQHEKGRFGLLSPNLGIRNRFQYLFTRSRFGGRGRSCRGAFRLRILFLIIFLGFHSTCASPFIRMTFGRRQRQRIYQISKITCRKHCYRSFKSRRSLFCVATLG